MKVSIIIAYDKDRGFLKDAYQSCMIQDGMRLGIDYEIVKSKGDHWFSINANNGIKQAKGKYIKILAEDDKLHRCCLKTLYDFAEQGKYDLVCADAVTFGTQTTIIKSSIPKTVNQFAEKNTIHAGTVLYKKSIMPLFDETLWTAEDYDLHLRMAAQGCRFGYIPQVVYYHRFHEKQKSGGGETPWIKGPDGETYRFEYIERLQGKYLFNPTLIK